MKAARWCLIVSLALGAAAPLVAATVEWQDDVRAQLMTRGLPADLAGSVAAQVREARDDGLPGAALVDKALEGWAKRVPPPRILAAVRELTTRLHAARDVLAVANVSASVGQESGVVTSAADAIGRGITREEIVEIVSSAPAADAAAAGLSVAAALAAQGVDRRQAVRIVVEAIRAGHAVHDVLDLPATARAMMGQGVPPADVGRRLLEGVGRGSRVGGRGQAEGRPPIVPPGLGGLNPGQTKRP